MTALAHPASRVHHDGRLSSKARRAARRPMTPRLLIAATLLVSAACRAPSADIAADKDQIARNIADWKELAKTGAPNWALAYFADDVMIFPAGQPVLKGLDAVRRFSETRTGPRRTTTWDVPSSITVARGGDLAYVVTGNSVTTTDPSGGSVTVRNKGIQIWRKEPDGSWKEIVVIVNAEPSQ